MLTRTFTVMHTQPDYNNLHQPPDNYQSFNRCENQYGYNLSIILKNTAIHLWIRTQQVDCQRRKTHKKDPWNQQRQIESGGKENIQICQMPWFPYVLI